MISGRSGLARISCIYNNQAGLFIADSTRSRRLAGVWYSSLSLADYDRDSDLDLALAGEDSAGGKYFQLYINDIPRQNTAPSSPAGLSAVQTDTSEIQFSWNEAADAEGGRLSYNIRIGATAEEEDILAGHSDLTSGRRKTAALGNAQLNTSWKIRGLSAGIYYWSVQAIDGNYEGSTWAVEKQFIITSDWQASRSADLPYTPADYLGSNSPNPFNASTMIGYGLKKEGDAALTIYTLNGELIKTLINKGLNAGHHSAVWDGTDENGISVPSGIYLYSLKVNHFIQTKIMMMLK